MKMGLPAYISLNKLTCNAQFPSIIHVLMSLFQYYMFAFVYIKVKDCEKETLLMQKIYYDLNTHINFKRCVLAKDLSN